VKIPRFLQCCCFRNTERSSCGFFYKLLFGHIKQLGIVLKRQFAADHYWVKSADGTKLDCMFFKTNVMPRIGDEIDDKKKPTFIICNSNAMFYQQMCHASHTFYLKFFLDKGVNVFTWNYRAYGRSRGTPTPDSLKTDIEAIYNFMRNEMGITGKIGVYGRSLGGIPASYISAKVDMAIIDRSFSSTSAMAYWKYRGKFAEMLFKVGTCGWQVQNDYNFIQSALPGDNNDDSKQDNELMPAKKQKKCYKVISVDKNDDIVDIQASLMFGVAEEICKKEKIKTLWAGNLGILDDAQCQELTAALHELIDVEEALFSLIQQSSYSERKVSSARKRGVRQGSQQDKQKSRSDAYKVDEASNNDMEMQGFQNSAGMKASDNYRTKSVILSDEQLRS